MRRNAGLLVVLFLAAGCGDDSDSGATQGTASAGSGGGAPGITKADCPGAPEGISLEQVAPYWDGLEAIRFTVPGGTPGSIRTETLDPALGTWAFSYGNANEVDGGGWLLMGSVEPREESKDASFKLRVRTELDGCAPSDWVETEAFQVGDPFADTTWKTHVDPSDYYSTVNANVVSGTGTTIGPYDLAESGIDHEVTFHGDGTMEETFSFGISSAHAGDVYAGCTFQVHFAADWRTEFQPYPRVLVTHREPTASPLSGSTCTNPPIAEMQLSQADYSLGSVDTTLSPNQIDYTPLLFAQPGDVVWRNQDLIGQIYQILSGLSDFEGEETTQLQGYFSFIAVEYVKQ